MYKGSCLCGEVRFEINGPIEDIVFCHCSRCRKAQGSAFATNANVNKSHFHFLQGEEKLTGYPSSEIQTKYFCSNCGSPIYSFSTQNPDTVRIRLGTIEGDISEKPRAHIFVDSRANWDQICDSLPQYKEYIDD